METSQGEARAQPFQFTGKGTEYFRIWIVNLALTILTLGIYSAWAKVRRLQYFYRNTSLAGASFDYHGRPLAILKGRVIAVGLLLLYNVAGTFNVALGFAMLAVLLANVPWLVQRSIAFKLANTSYRGLRFRFAGAMGGAYKAFLLWPFLGYVTLLLLMPKAHLEIKRYQHNNSRYGASSFRFDAGAGPFYLLYLKAFGMLLLLFGAFGLLLWGLATGPAEGVKDTQIAWFAIGMLAFYLLLFLVIGPWFAARMQNLVWNSTSLEAHAFSSDVRARDLFAIYFTNFIAIVLTLGLYKPFADIRLARYRLQNMALLAQGDLDAFVAAQQEAVSATGEEAADVFDVDISF